MLAIEIETLSRTFEDTLDLDAPSAGDAMRIMAGLCGFGRLRTRDGAQRALNEISLTVKRGHAVCIAGPSGSGKTTLLRILSGALPPTSGRVTLRGQVAHLLSAGENLDSQCSVLENIERDARLRGIVGEARARFKQEVLAFSGLAPKFHEIDVQRLSTGMRLRLSVALALKSGADILIIDDVLAVGDIAFQHQCADAMATFKRNGGTIVMATSDHELVERIADHVVEMRGGELLENRAIATAASGNGFGYHWDIQNRPYRNDVLAIQNVEASLAHIEDEHFFNVSIALAPIKLGLSVRPSVDVFSGRTQLFRTLCPDAHVLDRECTLTVRLPLSLLPAGAYRLRVNASSVDADVTHPLKFDDAILLEVTASENAHSDLDTGLLTPRLDWAVSEAAARP